MQRTIIAFIPIPIYLFYCIYNNAVNLFIFISIYMFIIKFCKHPTLHAFIIRAFNDY